MELVCNDLPQSDTITQPFTTTTVVTFLFSIEIFVQTRSKPAYGRQGLGWDRQARIQLRQVQFGVDTFWGNIYFLKYSGSGFPLLNKYHGRLREITIYRNFSEAPMVFAPC